MRIRDLPLAERLQLVEDIWDSIADEQEALPLTEAQRRLLEERLAAYEADRNAGVPAFEFLGQVRADL